MVQVMEDRKQRERAYGKRLSQDTASQDTHPVTHFLQLGPHSYLSPFLVMIMNQELRLLIRPEPQKLIISGDASQTHPNLCFTNLGVS